MDLLFVAILWASLVDRLNAQTPAHAQEPAAKVEEIQIPEEIKPKIVRVYVGELTAYSSRSEETDDTPFITAAGTPVRWGIVATNAYPFGTQLRFPEIYGERVFIVEDRMHSRYRNRIDVWFPEYEWARNFGLQHTKVEVVEIPSPDIASL